MAAVGALEFGALRRPSDDAVFRTAMRRSWTRAQRHRMDLYAAASPPPMAARSPCQVSWSSGCVDHRRVHRYSYGWGGAPRKPVRPVAPARASAFALPDAVPAPVVEQRPPVMLDARPVLLLFAGCDRP